MGEGGSSASNSEGSKLREGKTKSSKFTTNKITHFINKFGGKRIRKGNIET